MPLTKVWNIKISMDEDSCYNNSYALFELLLELFGCEDIEIVSIAEVTDDRSRE